MSCASFTGRYPHDQCLIAFKDKSLQTHSLNGKLIDKFAPNTTHSSEVKQLEINVKMGLLMSLSSEQCILWSTGQGNSIGKHRSIFSKDGNHLKQAKFTLDGQSLVTLFKDGDVI